MVHRCDWHTDDPLYLNYHDNQWGVPCQDDRLLFEMLILEGAQAGLSWITILKRREGYRQVYDGLDPEYMARWDDARIRQILTDRRIIRNRLKVNAARTNARAYLAVLERCGTFSSYIWRFVDGVAIQNRWRRMEQIPVTTPESDAMSRELKRWGFKFVGSTICYAYMQAVGMVNDHITTCFRHPQIKAMSEAVRS